MENNLTNLCKLLRYFVLTSTTKAGSGHPTPIKARASGMKLKLSAEKSEKPALSRV